MLCTELAFQLTIDPERDGLGANKKIELMNNDINAANACMRSASSDSLFFVFPTFLSARSNKLKQKVYEDETT
ncbi:uncharacterized protein FOMMEDRAFT_132548 [Fomitiporia mediterranea MF3/22]|uniref:uncharacterized protein n=1 Tax=Fomitiporia mediterranea (strain MF3/22) TaxID=694068 RepID=UPI0004409BBB|nr:uncharacterized protein FOMMEDRAFT_132548 [Fomitiporia mediterranea MF3/22]EJD06181.1 hypothetical protein FOMMEDRAFT_132548 [Fomitiporia mediterranea MF3/22]